MQVRVKSLVDCGVAGRGDVLEVEYTPFVQGLVRSRIMQILAVTRKDSDDSVWPVNPDPVVDDGGPETRQIPGPDASRREWREFLEAEGIEVPKKASLRHMRHLWTADG